MLSGIQFQAQAWQGITLEKSGKQLWVEKDRWIFTWKLKIQEET